MIVNIQVTYRMKQLDTVRCCLPSPWDGRPYADAFDSNADSSTRHSHRFDSTLMMPVSFQPEFVGIPQDLNPGVPAAFYNDAAVRLGAPPCIQQDLCRTIGIRDASGPRYSTRKAWRSIKGEFNAKDNWSCGHVSRCARSRNLLDLGCCPAERQLWVDGHTRRPRIPKWRRPNGVRLHGKTVLR